MKCLITGIEVQDYQESEQIISYNLLIHDHQYHLTFEKGGFWNTVLTPDVKHVLTTWLWNKIWPFEEYVVITTVLIERTLRQVWYPKEFNEKVDFFLLSYHMLGGKEYKEYQYNATRDFLFAYANDQDQFGRIIQAAVEEKWIRRNADTNGLQSVTMTGPGNRHAEELVKLYQLDKLDPDYRPLTGKRMNTVFVDEDKVWADHVNRELQRRGATVMVNNGITKTFHSYLHNFKNSYQSDDFILLIKSRNADKTRVWGDILTTIVNYEDNMEDPRVTFFVLCIDDSEFRDYQALFLREDRLIEIRIKQNLQNLFLKVFDAIPPPEGKTKPKITEAEERNLVALHDRLFDFLGRWSESDTVSINKFFYLRQKEDERFKKGYWFPGDERYINITFWTGGDALNRSQNIFFRIDTKKGIDVFIVARDSEDKRKYFQKIVSQLNGYQIRGSAKIIWVKHLADNLENLDHVLQSFISGDKHDIDAMLKQTLDRADEPDKNLLDDEFASKFGFLSHEQFSTLKSRVEAERTKRVREKKIAATLKGELPISINNLTVKNFQGIKGINLDESYFSPKAKWIFLTGENGFGKTSILRAIALGLTKYDFNRDFLDNESEIVLGYNTIDNFVQNSSRFAFTDNFKEINSRVVAFGANRLIVQPDSSEADESRNSINTYNLFKYNGVLRNIKHLIKNSLLKTNRLEYENLKAAIIKILDGKISDIKIDDKAEITFVESDPESQVLGQTPIENLATGFQGLINVAADIISRFSNDNTEISYSEYSGIVIIDELENHLHPIFQKRLPTLLSEIFPKIQFITSIHSPIPILGAPANSVILAVERNATDGVTVRRVDTLFDLGTLNPNLILTSPIFGFKDIFSVQYRGDKRIQTEDFYSDTKFNEEVKKRLDQFLNK